MMSIDVYYQQESFVIVLVKVHTLFSPPFLITALPYLVPDYPTATLYVLDLIDDLSLPPDALL
jgi:hypothetical protein